MTRVGKIEGKIEGEEREEEGERYRWKKGRLKWKRRFNTKWKRRFNTHKDSHTHSREIERAPSLFRFFRSRFPASACRELPCASRGRGGGEKFWERGGRWIPRPTSGQRMPPHARSPYTLSLPSAHIHTDTHLVRSATSLEIAAGCPMPLGVTPGKRSEVSCAASGCTHQRRQTAQ